MTDTIIHIRTSTEEQNPQNQLNDCLTLFNAGNYKEYKIFEEKVSAWKQIERPIFKEELKFIKTRKIKHYICWDLDRIQRNRKKLIEFFEYCKLYDCKIHSFRQKWLEDLNNIPSPFNEIMHSLMLQIMGWLAEEESTKRSDRVKLSIRKKNGVTRSYKGNKWGRKEINKRVINEILDKYKNGITMTQITKEVQYWDKNNNKRFVSVGLVHKIITKHRNFHKTSN